MNKKQDITGSQTPPGRIRVQEDSDVERAKAFWDENKWVIIGGVVIGLSIVIGFNYYQSYKAKQGVLASSLYEKIKQSDNLESAQELQSEMLDEFTSSKYATLSVLALAKLAITEKKLDEAKRYLTIAVDDADNGSGLAHIARGRLAQVHLASEDYQGVIDLLSNQKNSVFSAQYHDYLGDAYVGLNQIDNAKKAYEKSMELDTNEGNLYSQVEFKLLRLP